MATRYIGNAKLTITLNARNDTYKVAISAKGKHLSTQYVGVPAAWRGYGVDSPRAYDEAASAAASFEIDDRGPASDALEMGGTDGVGWIVHRPLGKRTIRKPAPKTRKNAPKTTRKPIRRPARKAAKKTRPARY